MGWAELDRAYEDHSKVKDAAEVLVRILQEWIEDHDDEQGRRMEFVRECYVFIESMSFSLRKQQIVTSNQKAAIINTVEALKKFRVLDAELIEDLPDLRG